MHKGLMEIAKIEESLKDYCELEKKLVQCIISCKYDVDSESGGQVIDMIKDLAEAKEKYWKSLYYKTVIEHMISSPNVGRYDYNDQNESAGYNMMPMLDRHDDMMGYNSNRSGGRNGSGRGSSNNSSGNSRYGYTYDMYNDAKRNYTETRSDRDKEDMNHKAEETVGNIVHITKDIWKDADPSFRKQMKTEFSKLVGEMNV